MTAVCRRRRVGTQDVAMRKNPSALAAVAAATMIVPTEAQSYDITSLVDRELATQKLGCAAS